MILKISQVDGVARLRNVNGHRYNLKPLTLIYGENGRGKSTLTSILRSLQSGDNDIIYQRKTKNCLKEPYVEILTDGNKHIFENNEWNQIFDRLEIFDAQFIFDNVVAGNYTTTDHDRRLVNVILGQENIELSNQILDIDEAIKAETKRLREKSRELERYIIGDDLSLNDYLELEPDPEIEVKIQQLTEELGSIQKKSGIINQSHFKEVYLPSINLNDFETLCSKSLELIQSDVEENVQQHLKNHAVSEDWIEYGIAVLDEECPFCGQRVDGLSIIHTYQSYFSDAYKEFKRKIVEFRDEFELEIMSETTVSKAISATETNNNLLPFWKSELDVDVKNVNVDDVYDIYNKLKTGLIKLLDRKQSSLLERINISDEVRKLHKTYTSMLDNLEKYNSSVQIANQKIADAKAALTVDNLDVKMFELELAQNISKRYDAGIVELCDEYGVLTEWLANKKSQKDELKTKLNKSNKFLSEFMVDVNEYLEFFGAEFSVSIKNRLGYQGRKPRINWGIGIDSVDVNTAEAFEHGLSEGDKSTLALSFFLARLKSKDLSKTVVVFDDPISSLDQDRRAQTREELLALCQKAKQVIILSHDKYFMRDLWQHKLTDNTQVQTLRVEPYNGYSTISVWNIEDATKNQFLKELDKLKNYLNGKGNLKDVTRAISVTLEEYFKTNFSNSISPNNSLNEIKNTINTHCKDVNRPDRALSKFEDDLDTITKINRFTTDHRHGHSTDELTYGMVKVYVKMTLDFLNKHTNI